MRALLFFLTMMTGLAHAGSSDICAVRPDLCDNDDASVSTLTRQAQRKSSRRGGARVATNVARGRANARVSTCRPSTVEPTDANKDLPVCGSALPRDGRRLASVSAPVAVQSVSFASYMNANAANPALSRKVANYQTAFKDTTKAATFVAPDVDGNGVREGAAPTVSSGPARNN